MRAARMYGYKQPLIIEDVPLPDAVAADEVLLKVSAAGMCRTDFQMLDGYFKDVGCSAGGIELKRPAEVLREYEASQQREPNRYRGIYGAGQAAAQSGDSDKARQYFSKLIELAGSGDPRPETTKARQFLASK